MFQLGKNLRDLVIQIILIGETTLAKIGYHGTRINTSQLTVDHAGLKLLLHPSLIDGKFTLV